VTPLVLVHGGMHGSWGWDPLLPLLDPPVVTVDLPGRGRRPAELSSVTLDDCVAAVLEDVEGLDRVTLVGHSMGGITITETAVRHPDRVAALVYVGALVPGPGQCAGDLMGTGPLEAMPVLPEDVARPLFGTGLDDEAWAHHYAGLVPDAPGIYNATLSGYPSGIPVTYVSMSLDQPVPPELAARMAANLGDGVDHRVIEGAGHTIMVERPEALAAILREVRL
jgi:pimeloyl-ACP methyl ester carboxylesterase